MGTSKNRLNSSRFLALIVFGLLLCGLVYLFLQETRHDCFLPLIIPSLFALFTCLAAWTDSSVRDAHPKVAGLLIGVVFVLLFIGIFFPLAYVSVKPDTCAPPPLPDWLRRDGGTVVPARDAGVKADRDVDLRARPDRAPVPDMHPSTPEPDLGPDTRPDAFVVQYSPYSDPRWIHAKNSRRLQEIIANKESKARVSKELLSGQITLLQAYYWEAKDLYKNQQKYPPRKLTCELCQATLALIKRCRYSTCEYSHGRGKGKTILTYTPPADFEKYRKLLSQFLTEDDKALCLGDKDCD